VPARYLLAGHGADELIDLVMRLFVEPGDAVLNCPPTFGMYPFDAAVNGARVLSLSRRADFSLDTDAIMAAVAEEPRAKLLFVTSPNNPDGGLLPDADLGRLLELPLVVVLGCDKVLGAGHIAAEGGVEAGGLMQGAGQGFEKRLGPVVIVATGQQTGVQVHARFHGQRLKKVRHQAGSHVSDTGRVKTPVKDTIAPPADIHGHQRQRLVHGHDGVAHAGDAHIFHRVVLIDVQVAAGVHGQIETGVAGQGDQHMIQKADAGVDLGRTAPVKIQADFDLSLARLAANRRLPCAHDLPLHFSQFRN
jgi:hypothetical protein